MTLLEVSANAVLALAIFLAGRNSIHTWWLGIVGCALFAALFFENRLYADVTLQIFFVLTNAIGWYQWAKGADGDELPVTRTKPLHLLVFVAAGLLMAFAYGSLLQRFTDAYAPFWDSLLLAISIIAQLLLMNRKLENWLFWLVANSIAVPLYFSRGLELTSALYAAYWINAVVAYFVWRRIYRTQSEQTV